MSLTEYRKKRNLKKSGEPSVRARSYREAKNKKSERGHEEEGKIKSSKRNRFVVHEHHASHLHWDLRLEMNGVLKSWAVPKIPPRTKGEKRLAIQVEDHPLNYAKFHRVIPEGNYGAGEVKIWDRGNYELKFHDSKKIEIILHGKKLKGNYALIRTHYGSKPDKSWLFMKI